jgi:hypothetical protein
MEPSAWDFKTPDPVALHLRAMNMLCDAIKERLHGDHAAIGGNRPKCDWPAVGSVAVGTVENRWKAGNPARSRLSAGSGRLKGGCGQDWPPSKQICPSHLS